MFAVLVLGATGIIGFFIRSSLRYLKKKCVKGAQEILPTHYQVNQETMNQELMERSNLPSPIKPAPAADLENETFEADASST